MINWKKIFSTSPINWLLEEANPSVRYFALRDLLDKDENDPQVAATRKAIPKSRPIQNILDKQKPEGYWEEPWSPYNPKYKSSYWQTMILSQLGMDKTDQRTRKACEHIFTFQTEEEAFSSSTRQLVLKEHEQMLKDGKNPPPKKEFTASLVHEHQYSCLTGNMAAALIRTGYADDPRVKKALKWLVKIQNKDGGWLCPYWKPHARDKHGCFYGTVCPMEAFSLVKKEERTGEMKTAIKKGAEFLLMHRLFKADHHGHRIINPHWLTLSFPVFYNYNILRGLDVLTRLDYASDERLQDAVQILLQKRQPNGSWILESTPAGRMHTNIEAKGKPSKWITLIALRSLKRINLAAAKH